MEKRTQFTVMATNKPGELAWLAKILGKAKVNIEAISINDGVHHGVVKIVVDDAKAARKALKKAELAASEQDVLAVALADKPGAMADLCAKLARKGVNIDYIYGSTCACGEGGCSCECRVILSVTDAAAARAALT
jgi:hypothetical protein